MLIFFQSYKEAFIVSNIAVVIYNVLLIESGQETSEDCDLLPRITLQAYFVPIRSSQWFLEHQFIRQEAHLMYKRVFIFA